jgi:Cu-Zn family superoxide dismutase
VVAALVAACGAMPEIGTGNVAVAELQPTKGNNAAGTVTFTQRGKLVRVEANVRGLKPDSEHGFHVHEKGDCGSGDGMSAGGHFNPAAAPHGNYHAGGAMHAGDMPNLRADGEGNARATFDMAGMMVGSGSADVVGKGLIVHREPDDYKSQPAGNAGPRLACAVIRKR